MRTLPKIAAALFVLSLIGFIAVPDNDQTTIILVALVGMMLVTGIVLFLSFTLFLGKRLFRRNGDSAAVTVTRQTAVPTRLGSLALLVLASVIFVVVVRYLFS